MSLPVFDGPALLGWYRAHRRRMPWREEVSPYRTLVSEVMLQQTRVETVIPYFERFVSRFPDFEALAAAPLEDVLARWSGLGYYRRARMLHAAARAVVAQGGVPRTPDALRALPGVGPYTAGAVGSIALGLDMAAVDGNVERVLCRHDARPEPPAAIRRALWARAEALVPPGQAGDHNQALMELGATVCTPVAPACERCPLATGCLGRADPTLYPARVAKRPVPEAHCHVARVVEDGAVLLVRRAGTGLLGGLWELPGSVPSAEAEDADALAAALARRVGVRVTDSLPCATVTHVFTHLRLHATVHAVRLVPGTPPRPGDGYDDARWVSLGDVGDMALSTWARKTLRAGALRGRPEPPPQELRSSDVVSGPPHP